MRYRTGFTRDELPVMGVFNDHNEEALLSATERSDVWFDELLDLDDEALLGWSYDDPEVEYDGDEYPI